jgi:poly(hydroxyalkanoate) depolymerase family esterase
LLPSLTILQCSKKCCNAKGRLMAGIGSSLSRIRTLRNLFEQKLKGATAKRLFSTSSVDPTRLREVTKFGANPGNLRMHVYVPENIGPSPSLVVALHGCTQTAAAYDSGTGWSHLSDRFGFIIVFPEQQPANNPKSCFSWFLQGDTARDLGEALSIREMIAAAVESNGVHRSRIFVTGLSAGGAMASVMLATYSTSRSVAEDFSVARNKRHRRAAEQCRSHRPSMAGRAKASCTCQRRRAGRWTYPPHLEGRRWRDQGRSV